jgi:1,4-alpha-glucan branching enzyme
VPYQLKIHFDLQPAFADPHVWIWYDSSALPDDVRASGTDSYGAVFDVTVKRKDFGFKFKHGPGVVGPWEADGLDRYYEPVVLTPTGNVEPAEIWVRGHKPFWYPVEPRAAAAPSAADVVAGLPIVEDVYVPRTGGLSGLGATPLRDGRVLFGFYHPNAARVYVIGSFNNFQRPGHDHENPAEFLECALHRGYDGVPNTWLAVTDRARVGDEYKFSVIGGVPRDRHRRPQQHFPDPYTRQFGPDFGFNNSVVCDPSRFRWSDDAWHTPDMHELIVYELSVFGFTEGDPDIEGQHRGKFAGITERIRAGYFNRLGVTALSLMPLTEIPDVQGPGTLGYNPSLYCTVERDFGSPDDLRTLVNEAHTHGLAVLLDVVYNHTSNDFNPLWKMVLEHPDEEASGAEGGLYFHGSTPWGNRVATEKTDVQNMLIDACRLFIHEYHVDGFRFDATHTNYMDHGFLRRLHAELKAAHPRVLLVCENLPNQADLNISGFDGFAQWCDQFHDKLKAMLREGSFDNAQHFDTQNLAEIFFFSRNAYAVHTNNVVNYCVSHDEHSIPHEVGSNPALNHPAGKERKGRLGLFATMVALGQPMIYMGQEFNQEQQRNIVTVHWPDDVNQHGFFQWASRLISLRRRYPGLKLFGYNPAETGQFTWILGHWMAPHHGGGKRLLGWRSRVNAQVHEALVVLLNFEPFAVTVDLELGIPGLWVKLADIDTVHDLPPAGTNSASDPTALRSQDGRFANFVLPSSSGFIYKWAAAL